MRRAIFDPVSDELFGPSGLVLLNSRPLRVTRREDLSEALFATGLPFKGPSQDGVVASVERVSWASAVARRAGRRRWISPTSPPDATTASGSVAGRPGMWSRAV